MELSRNSFHPSLWSYLGTVSIHLYGAIKAQSPAIFKELPGHRFQPFTQGWRRVVGDGVGMGGQFRSQHTYTAGQGHVYGPLIFMLMCVYASARFSYYKVVSTHYTDLLEIPGNLCVSLEWIIQEPDHCEFKYEDQHKSALYLSIYWDQQKMHWILNSDDSGGIDRILASTLLYCICWISPIRIYWTFAIS